MHEFYMHVGSIALQQWLAMTIGFGCFRYCLDMRLQPGRMEDAVVFVQRQCPTAQLLNRTADRLSFSVPQQVNSCLLGHCCLMQAINQFKSINQSINSCPLLSGCTDLRFRPSDTGSCSAYGLDNHCPLTVIVVSTPRVATLCAVMLPVL